MKTKAFTTLKRSKQEAGFSLVELVISVAIFAVIMLLVTGIVVNGLKARKNSKLDIDAQNYVYTILEQFKSDWSNQIEYLAFDGTDPNTYPEPVKEFLDSVPFPFTVMSLDFDCVELDGSIQSPCDNPPLRRVSLSLIDNSGKVGADLITEIGHPRPGAIN